MSFSECEVVINVCTFVSQIVFFFITCNFLCHVSSIAIIDAWSLVFPTVYIYITSSKFFRKLLTSSFDFAFSSASVIIFFVPPFFLSVFYFSLPILQLSSSFVLLFCFSEYLVIFAYCQLLSSIIYCWLLFLLRVT